MRSTSQSSTGDPRLAAIPSCPACGSLVRPHVLWFDELYVSHADYQWHVVHAAAPRIQLLICVGTSLAVGVTSFLQSAAAGAAAPVFLVDPGERPRDAHPSMVHVRARAEELLPQLCSALRPPVRRVPRVEQPWSYWSLSAIIGEMTEARRAGSSAAIAATSARLAAATTTVRASAGFTP